MLASPPSVLQTSTISAEPNDKYRRIDGTFELPSPANYPQGPQTTRNEVSRPEISPSLLPIPINPMSTAALATVPATENLWDLNWLPPISPVNNDEVQCSLYK